MRGPLAVAAVCSLKRRKERRNNMTPLTAFIAGATIVGALWVAHYCETSTYEEPEEQQLSRPKWVADINDLKIEKRR